MPALANARHERFAQGLAQGKTADQAYEDAGFKPNRHNASRLKTNETIRARVEELTNRAADGVMLTRQWVLEQLAENASKAKERNDFGPSNKAIELIGKHLGMFDGKGGDDDDEAPSLNINIAVRSAVGDVRVTKPERSPGDIPEGTEHQV